MSVADRLTKSLLDDLFAIINYLKLCRKNLIKY